MKKLFTFLTMLVLGIGISWGQTNPVVVAFGNSSGISGLTTDAFDLGGRNNPSGTLSDGTTYAFTTNQGNIAFWAGNDGNIEGSWENTSVIADINTELATTTAFDATYFSSGSNLKYLATGNGGSYSTLTLTFNNKKEGDRITLYASLARRGGTLGNFSATGLNGMQIKYARKGVDGFSDTQVFSQRSGSNNDSPVTIVKITGTLGSDKQISMSSTSAKNGWQMIAYRFYYHQVTFNCKVGEELIYTEYVSDQEGEAIDVPNLPGYSASPSSVTVGNSDASVDISYTPNEYPVNFPSGQTFTRSDRHINSVTFDIAGEDQTVDGVYQNTSTKCYQDLTASKTVKLPINTSVTPQFSLAGSWQHVFVYVDWNNDGDFTDEGELVSKINAGNPGSNPTLPVFTTGASAGSYRMRIKTDWASEDPGGNTGSSPHLITSSNHIIANGGMIIDVTLDLFEPQFYVQYIVEDEFGNTLFESGDQTTTQGTHITTLPAEYQKTDFYEYNTLDITISEVNTTATFTATIKDAPLVKFTADTTTPVWYKMKLKDDNYPTYVNGTPNVTTPTTNADDETVQWAFIGNPYAGFHIICRAAKDGSDNYLVLGSGTTTGSGSEGGGVYATFAAEDSQNNELWDIRPSNYLTGGFFIFNKEGHALNERNTANLAYWTGGNDKGSTFTATEVLEGEALFNSLVEELKAIRWGLISEGNKGKVNYYNLTSGAGNLYGYAGNELTLVNILKENGYSEENLGYAQTMFDNHALNMPANGFYRFTSQNNSHQKGNVGKYIHNYLTDDAITDGLALNTTKDETTIFYVDRTDNSILSYANGKYLNSWSSEPSIGISRTWTIMEGLEKGKYAIEVSGSQTWYVSDWYYSDRITYGQKDANALWTIEEVTSLPLETNSDGYTTFSAPVPVTIPSDCNAFIAKSQGDGVINLEKVTGNVAANTGLIISTKRYDDNELTFNIVASGTDYSDDNLLVANVAANNIDKANNYFFGKYGDNYVFTKISGEGTRTLAGHKAYLDGTKLAGTGARISISWDIDNPTGIDELKNDGIELKDGKYYQKNQVVIVRNGVKYNVAGQIIK